VVALLHSIAPANFTFYLLICTARLWLSDLPKHVAVCTYKECMLCLTDCKLVFILENGRFYFLSSGFMSIRTCSDVTPYQPLNTYWRLGEACCFPFPVDTAKHPTRLDYSRRVILRLKIKEVL
jgi:hypothetical protein